MKVLTLLKWHLSSTSILSSLRDEMLLSSETPSTCGFGSFINNVRKVEFPTTYTTTHDKHAEVLLSKAAKSSKENMYSRLNVIAGVVRINQNHTCSVS